MQGGALLLTVYSLCYLQSALDFWPHHRHCTQHDQVLARGGQGSNSRLRSAKGEVVCVCVCVCVCAWRKRALVAWRHSADENHWFCFQCYLCFAFASKGSNQWGQGSWSLSVDGVCESSMGFVALPRKAPAPEAQGYPSIMTHNS